MEDTQVSGADELAQNSPLTLTHTHRDNLTGTILERLWIFWEPDVCLCFCVCLYVCMREDWVSAYCVRVAVYVCECVCD